ncbi:MAG: DUF2281 domain-containing protein [Blastocatellia bacterium]
MSIDQSVIEILKDLPPDKQQEVLDFARSLQQQTAAGQSRRSLKGALAYLNIHFTTADLAEARRGMWREGR